MKANIEQLKKDSADAKARQAEALKDIKRIEKDMKDFDSNKDGKLAELQTMVSVLKKSQIKNSVSVKTQQKELQSSRLEAEQAGADLGAAQEQLAEVNLTLKAQEAEINGMQKEQAHVKVRQFKVILKTILLTFCVGCSRLCPGAPRRRAGEAYRI